MADKLEPLAVRPSEAARVVDVSRTTLYRWIHRADFPVIHLGGCTESPWMVCGSGLQSRRR